MPLFEVFAQCYALVYIDKNLIFAHFKTHMLDLFEHLPQIFSPAISKLLLKNHFFILPIVDLFR